jgi:hypothetical protein
MPRNAARTSARKLAGEDEARRRAEERVTYRNWIRGDGGERVRRLRPRSRKVHYHAERNHKGLANVIPFPSPISFTDVGNERRRQRLGGLLNFYKKRRVKPQIDCRDSTRSMQL